MTYDVDLERNGYTITNGSDCDYSDPLEALARARWRWSEGKNGGKLNVKRRYFGYTWCTLHDAKTGDQVGTITKVGT